jgi:hypothetical protein
MVGYAHRVRAADGTEGINVFLHLHGEGFVWPETPWSLAQLAEHPGTLVWKRVQVPPGGNKVLSFLDVIAPDDTPESDVEDILVPLVFDLGLDDDPPGLVPPLPNPFLFQRPKGWGADKVIVRFGVADELLSRRVEEYQALRDQLAPARPRPWRGFAQGEPLPDDKHTITFNLPVEFHWLLRDVPALHYSRVSGALGLTALNRHYGFEDGEIPYDTPKGPDHEEHCTATSRLARGGTLRVTMRINRDGSFDFVRAEGL